MTFLFVYFTDELQSCGIRRGTELIRPTVPRGFTRETRPASRENPCASKKEVTRAYAALKEVFPKRFVPRHLPWRRQQLCLIYTPLRGRSSKLETKRLRLLYSGIHSKCGGFSQAILGSFELFIASWTKETI